MPSDVPPWTRRKVGEVDRSQNLDSSAIRVGRVPRARKANRRPKPTPPRIIGAVLAALPLERNEESDICSFAASVTGCPDPAVPKWGVDVVKQPSTSSSSVIGRARQAGDVWFVPTTRHAFSIGRMNTSSLQRECVLPTRARWSETEIRRGWSVDGGNMGPAEATSGRRWKRPQAISAKGSCARSCQDRSPRRVHCPHS